MPWQNANSSMISAYDYDPDMQVLHVRFRTGSTYSFQGVPATLVQQFEAAPSMGKFFHNQIRDQYRAL